MNTDELDSESNVSDELTLHLGDGDGLENEAEEDEHLIEMLEAYEAFSGGMLYP